MVPIPEGVETSEEEPDDEAFQDMTGSGGFDPVGVPALDRVRVTIGRNDEMRG